MGNDIFERRLVGKLDNVVFDTRAMSPNEITSLTCVEHPPSVIATPKVSPNLAPGTAFSYDITLVNNDSATCAPRQFFSSPGFIPELSTSIEPRFLGVPASGQGHLNLLVQSSSETEPNTFTVPF